MIIRHTSDHRIIALIEIVSSGNKVSQHAFRTFVQKASACLEQGIHLLVVDLFPRTPRDPDGIHTAIWQDLTGEEVAVPADKPLTLASYTGGPVNVAYVEPVAVGEVLIDMPLFLIPEDYVSVPLATGYVRAYEGVPQFYRSILEG